MPIFSLKYSGFHSRKGGALVANADEVVGKTLDGGGCVSGNRSLSVVSDDDGLLGLGDSDAEAALDVTKNSESAYMVRVRIARVGLGRVVQSERKYFGPRPWP